MVALRSMSRPSTLHFDVFGDRRRQRNFYSIFFHPIKMELNCLPDQSFCFFNRFADGDTSWKIRNKSSVACVTFLDNDGVTHIGLTSNLLVCGYC